MASGALQEFFISLGLDSDAASFASAEASVDALEKALEKLVEWAERAFEALIGAVEGTAKYGSQLDDASKKTGESTQALEEWTYIASLVGGSSESVQGAMTHLARKMGEVKNGSKEATEAFARLGVRVFDGDGKMRALDDVLSDVSDGLAKTPAGAERMAAAFGVMGKGGADNIPILGEGSAKLAELREQFRATVGALTDDQILMLDKFDDALVTLRAAGNAIVREFAMPIIEALQPVVDRLLRWISANRQLITQKVTEWGKRVAIVLVAVARGFEWLIEHFDGVVSALTQIAMAFALVGTTILITTLPALYEMLVGFALVASAAIISAAATIGAWLAAAAPFISVIAFVGLLILAFDDLFVFLRGGDSVLGHILNNYGDRVVEFLERTRKKIAEFMASAFGPLGELAFEVGLAGVNKAGLSVGDFVSGGAQSPAAAAALQSSSTSTNRSTNVVQTTVPITIQTQPGQSSEAVGKVMSEEVADVVDRRNRDALQSHGD
jgi:hypothetical protein